MPKEVEIMDVPGLRGSIWYSVNEGYLLKTQDVSLPSLIEWVLKNFGRGDIESQINEYVRRAGEAGMDAAPLAAVRQGWTFNLQPRP